LLVGEGLERGAFLEIVAIVAIATIGVIIAIAVIEAIAIMGAMDGIVAIAVIVVIGLFFLLNTHCEWVLFLKTFDIKKQMPVRHLLSKLLTRYS
jgi:hypothetical protein